MCRLKQSIWPQLCQFPLACDQSLAGTLPGALVARDMHSPFVTLSCRCAAPMQMISNTKCETLHTSCKLGTGALPVLIVGPVPEPMTRVLCLLAGHSSYHLAWQSQLRTAKVGLQQQGTAAVQA